MRLRIRSWGGRDSFITIVYAQNRAQNRCRALIVIVRFEVLELLKDYLNGIDQCLMPPLMQSGVKIEYKSQILIFFFKSFFFILLLLPMRRSHVKDEMSD